MKWRDRALKLLVRQDRLRLERDRLAGIMSSGDYLHAIADGDARARERLVDLECSISADLKRSGQPVESLPKVVLGRLTAPKQPPRASRSRTHLPTIEELEKRLTQN
jgi:hypothetical protein